MWSGWQDSRRGSNQTTPFVLFKITGRIPFGVQTEITRRILNMENRISQIKAIKQKIARLQCQLEYLEKIQALKEEQEKENQND